MLNESCGWGGSVVTKDRVARTIAGTIPWVLVIILLSVGEAVYYKRKKKRGMDKNKNYRIAADTP